MRLMLRITFAKDVLIFKSHRVNSDYKLIEVSKLSRTKTILLLPILFTVTIYYFVKLLRTF